MDHVRHVLHIHARKIRIQIVELINVVHFKSWIFRVCVSIVKLGSVLIQKEESVFLNYQRFHKRQLSMLKLCHFHLAEIMKNFQMMEKVAF